MTVMYCKLTITYNYILPSVYMFRITGRWKRDLRTIGRAGVAVFFVRATGRSQVGIYLKPLRCEPEQVAHPRLSVKKASGNHLTRLIPGWHRCHWTSCRAFIVIFNDLKKWKNVSIVRGKCLHRWKTDLHVPTTGRGGIAVCSVPCKRRVAGWNLLQATAYPPWKNCSPQLSVKQRETISLVSSPSGVKFTGPTMVTRIHRHHHQ